MKLASHDALGNDGVANLPSDASPSKRGPGRPKGLGKVPGSGRKKGVTNFTVPEVRNALLGKSNAIEQICKIAAGEKMRWSGPTGKAVTRYPTSQEQLSALRLIVDKTVPSLQAVELTGAGGEPLIPEKEQDPRQMARAILSLLGSAVPDSVDEDDEPQDASVPRAAFEFTAERFEPLDPIAALDLDPTVPPVVGERILCGTVGCWVERTSDNRWRNAWQRGAAPISR